MITVATDIEIDGVLYKDAPPEKLADAIEDMGEEFVEKAELVHRKSVFEILLELIRLTPVDSGRLRGSWTAFFAKHGAEDMYQNSLERPAPGQATTKTKFSPKAFAEGQADGEFIDQPFDTTIASNVVYSKYVERRLKFVLKALAKGQTWYKENFRNFYKAIGREHGIPDVDFKDNH